MKRILVCLDGSQRAPHVLDTAVHLAHHTGAKIQLFRAVTVQPELSPPLVSMSPNEVPSLLLEEAKKELAALGRDVPAGALEGLFTQIGSPWDAICAIARAHDVDLIVIGSHGYGGLDRLLGTTAAKVVNHADRSVLVVRPKPESRQ